MLSRRYRVRDNLLGGGNWRPVNRRSERLEKFVELGLADRVGENVGRTGQHLLARVARVLLLAESREGFEIEGERAPNSRFEGRGKVVCSVMLDRLYDYRSTLSSTIACSFSAITV